MFHTPGEEGEAQITFGWMFNELSKTDPEGLLKDLIPKDLQLDEGDMVLKMLETTPRYGDFFATRVWMDQAPLIEKLELGWERLNLTDSIGPILKTDGRFYDVWNESNPLTQQDETLEGVRSINTTLANGIMRRTNTENIVEGYVIEEQVEGAAIHREFWGLTRTIFKDGNTRIELHGDDFATGEHTLLAEFEFDQYYVEDTAARFDVHGYFHDVTADDFKTLETAKPATEGFMK